MAEFVKEVESFLSDLISRKKVPLEDAEVLILEKVRSWKPKLLEMCVSQHPSVQDHESVACPECQQACVPLCQRERNFMTVCGSVRVRRWVYRCGRGHRHSPWESKQKLRDIGHIV